LILAEDVEIIVVNKSMAHPWECDVKGHLTTRFYVAMFDLSTRKAIPLNDGMISKAKKYLES